MRQLIAKLTALLDAKQWALFFSKWFYFLLKLILMQWMPSFFLKNKTKPSEHSVLRIVYFLKKLLILFAQFK